MSRAHIIDVEKELAQFKNKTLITEDYRKTVIEWSKVSAVSGFFGGPTFGMERVISLNGKKTATADDAQKAQSVTITCPEDKKIKVVLKFESTIDLPIKDVKVQLYSDFYFSENALIKETTTNEKGEAEFTGLVAGKQYFVKTHDPKLVENNEKMLKAYDELMIALHDNLNQKWQGQYKAEWEKANIATEVSNAIDKGILDSIKGLFEDLALAYNVITDPIKHGKKIWEGASKAADMLGKILVTFTEVDLNQKLEENKEKTQYLLALFNDEASLFIMIRAISLGFKIYPFHKLFSVLAGIGASIVMDIIIGLFVGALLTLIAAPLGVAYMYYKLVKRAKSHAAAIKLIMTELEGISKLFNDILKKHYDATKKENLERQIHNNPLKKDAENHLGSEDSAHLTDEASKNKDQSSKNQNDNSGQCDTQTCKSGCPVSMVTGEELLSLDDAQLFGFVPFVFKRLYRTSAVESPSSLGFGWRHSLMHDILFDDRDQIIWTDHENLTITLPCPTEQRPRATNLLAESAAFLSDTDNEYLLTSGSTQGLFLHVQRHGNTGRVTGFSNQAGQYLELEYQRNGLPSRLSALTDRSDGFSLHLIYTNVDLSENISEKHASNIRLDKIVFERYQPNADGNLRWEPIVDLMRYAYDKSGQLSYAMNAMNEAEQYRYRNDYVISLRKMAGGAQFYWEWEGTGKNARAVRHYGNMANFDQTYAWSNSGHVSVIHSDGRRESYRHSLNTARLIEKSDPDGAIHRYEYGDSGELLAEIDPLGNETRYAYDSNLALIQVIYPDYSGERYTHSFRGELIKKEVFSADRQHVVKTHYRYDEDGNRIEQTDDLGQITRYKWSNTGKITRIDYPDETYHELNYNSFGLLDSETTPDHRHIIYRYDAMGNIISRQIGAAITCYKWDKANRLRILTHPNGQTQTFDYNAYGKVTVFIDENGQKTQYAYAEPLHLCTQETKPNGQILKYSYDNTHNFLSKIVNEQGRQYQIKYHPSGLVKEERTFDDKKFNYEYDLNGFLLQKIEYGMAGNDDVFLKTNYLRDRFGRLLEKTLPDESVVRYTYDKFGNLTTVDDGKWPIGYTYDDRQRLIAEHQGFYTTYFAYDGVDNLIAMVLPDKNRIEYVYDKGLLTKTMLNGRELMAHEMNFVGQERSRRHGALTQINDYDDQNRLHKQRVESKFKHDDLVRREYQYDPAGNLLNKYDTLKGKTEYQYSSINTLSQMQHTPHRSGIFGLEDRYESNSLANINKNKILGDSFSYSPAGHMFMNARNEDFGSLIQYRGSLVLRQKTRSFEYDHFGNLIRESDRNYSLTSATKLYEYDCQHRLIRFQNIVKKHDFTYEYDPFGRRIKKTNLQDEKSIRYLWQANRLLAEVNDEGFFDPDDAQINQNYTTYLHEPGTHIPSVMFKGKGSEAEPYFYINDHLGTPQELVDFDGNIVWAALYEAYGMVNAVLIPKITQNIRFQGQYFDAESGLHYNRHRYYDPTTGRYITQDPIGLAGGLNSTQYVKNPTGWVDPLGLTCIPGNCPPKDKTPDDKKEVEPEPALLASEGDVGTYSKLKAAGKPYDNITPHHIPADNYMSQYGIKTKDGIAINMEQPNPGSGGRHRRTDSYGKGADLSKSPRQALANDIRDARKIYKQDGLYNQKIHLSLKQVIQQNKESFPNIFKKD